MKNIWTVLSLFLLPLTLSAAPIPYSGKVAINGLNFQGDAQFTFALRDANGTVHWRNGVDADSSINVSVDRGLYVVQLGGQGMNPIPNNLFLDHPELYLQIRFFRLDTGQWLHLQPDQRITSAPHALSADVANLAKLADAVKPGAITKNMLAAEVLADLNATVVLPELNATIQTGSITREMLAPGVLSDLNATITPGSITAGQLAPALLADLNRSVVITRNMLPQSVLADLNRTLLRTDLPTDVLADLNRTITRNMLPADVLADLNATAIQSGSITAGMLAPSLLTDLNASGGTAIAPGSITANLLAPGLLDQNVTISPGSITKAMLAADVLADLNASGPAVDGNGSTTTAPAGSLIAVQSGQSAPAGYSMYQQGEPKNFVWEEKAPVSVARYAGDGVEALAGKLYFVGGWIESSSQSITERYDPATNQWETLAAMSVAREGLTAAVLNGKLYAIGGVGLTSVEIFDPATGQWSAGPALPSEVRYGTAITVDGKILLVGGRNSADQELSQVLELNPATNQWSQKAPMPTASLGHKLVLFEGKIWAIGGWTSSPTNKVEIYDPSNDSWTVGSSLLSPRSWASAWVANGRIFVVGGYEPYLDSIEVYDPGTNQWSTAGTLPENKGVADSAVLGDKVYVVAGRTGTETNDYSNKVYAADLNASVAGVFDLYRRDGNASASGTTVSSEFSDGSVTPSKLSAEVVAALKPVILQQPQSITAIGGTSATFVTQATGGNLAYQWLQQGYAIAGGNGNILTITDLNATLHDGNYTVTVTNAFGSTTSAVATLEVDDSLMQGLVGWWQFDETSGTVATDSSGNGNHGTLQNSPTWFEGKVGGALSFDGSNDFVSLPDIRSHFNQAASVAMWVKVETQGHVGNKGGLVHFGTGSNLHYPHGDGLIHMNVLRDNLRVVNISPTTNFASWHLFAATTETGGNWRMYQNTTLTSETTATQVGIPAQAFLGKSIGSDGTWFLHGLLDDVRIYDRALTAGEVTALYNLGSETSGTTTTGGGTTIVADSGPVTTEKVSDGAITTAKLSETILKYLRPEITAHPQAQSVYADSNASFSVSAEGKYLTYQWKKNGVNLTGETNATLTITDANATLHDGNYTIVVSNDFGSVESNAGELSALPFSPASLSLVLWLDASDGSSIVETNNKISEWRDKSGNNNHAVQGDAQRQPDYNSTGWSGQPVVHFNEDGMFFGNPVTAKVVYFVSTEPNGSNTNISVSMVLGESPPESTSLNDYVFIRTSVDDSSYDISIDGQTSANGLASVNGNVSVTGGDINLQRTDLQNKESNLWYVQWDAGRQLSAVAYEHAQGVAQYAKIKIAELILINSVPSVSDRQKIESYLAHKWGLTDKLPVNHPYKNSAP